MRYDAQEITRYGSTRTTIYFNKYFSYDATSAFVLYKPFEPVKMADNLHIDTCGNLYIPGTQSQSVTTVTNGNDETLVKLNTILPLIMFGQIPSLQLLGNDQMFRNRFDRQSVVSFDGSIQSVTTACNALSLYSTCADVCDIFVAGTFAMEAVGGVKLNNIAIWNAASKSWRGMTNSTQFSNLFFVRKLDIGTVLVTSQSVFVEPTPSSAVQTMFLGNAITKAAVYSVSGLSFALLYGTQMHASCPFFCIVPLNAASQVIAIPDLSTKDYKISSIVVAPNNTVFVKSSDFFSLTFNATSQIWTLKKSPYAMKSNNFAFDPKGSIYEASGTEKIAMAGLFCNYLHDNVQTIFRIV